MGKHNVKKCLFPTWENGYLCRAIAYEHFSGSYSSEGVSLKEEDHSNLIRVPATQAIPVYIGDAYVWLLSDGALTSGADLNPSGLVAVAVCHGLALFVAVAIAANISGGHVNPAVTFGLFVGGNITLLKGILYWIAQLLGATVACLLLRLVTSGATTSPHALSTGEPVYGALVLEIVITFGLVYTVYATAADPRAKGNVGILAPLAIGLIVAANILFAGAFDGGSMNPARSFGPALVAWDFTNHWVYWVGPLIGGALAGIIYELLIMGPEPTHQPLPGDEY